MEFIGNKTWQEWLDDKRCGDEDEDLFLEHNGSEFRILVIGWSHEFCLHSTVVVVVVVIEEIQLLIVLTNVWASLLIRKKFRLKKKYKNLLIRKSKIGFKMSF